MHRCEQNGLTFYRFAGLAGHPDVGHALFTRLGGVSDPPFAELNLGHTVGDDPAAVEENHHRIYRQLEVVGRDVVTAWLVHGSTVRAVDGRHGGQVIGHTDGLITRARGLILFQRFADCLPVLFYDPVRSAVGIAHAGWRGTMVGIVPATVRAMQATFGSRPQDLWVGIGPGIGPCCYEVGADVVDAARSAFEDAGVLLPSVNGSVHFDLPAANVHQLRRSGVEHIEAADICTACRMDEFFSHRAEGGETGRFGVAIGLSASSSHGT